ncbi:Pycsar system effector family protein [Streptomyces sp. NPDC088135]|uniref:Pycsar system effector family protein n=1 Tax=Streptomyces sp. NPDC088135 TaxID=3160993 RepID=UPI0034390357
MTSAPDSSDPHLDARLNEAAANLFAELSRTDTKAGHLLTSFSLPLAVLVAAVPGRGLPPAAVVLIGAGVVGLIAAMLIVLTVLHPRVSRAPRGSWVYWASCTPDELVDDLRNPASRKEHVIHLARITRRKFTGLRLAGIITGVSLVALGAALLAALALN